MNSSNLQENKAHGRPLTECRFLHGTVLFAGRLHSILRHTLISSGTMHRSPPEGTCAQDHYARAVLVDIVGIESLHRYRIAVQFSLIGSRKLVSAPAVNHLDFPHDKGAM